MNLNEILTPSVCLIAMKSQCEAKEIIPGMHLPYYQVTIDPRQCSGADNGYSPSREFIRFGRAKGDELNGWIPCHEVEIFEVMAEVEDDKEIYDALNLPSERTLMIGNVEHKVIGIDDIIEKIEILGGVEMLKEQAL